MIVTLKALSALLSYPGAELQQVAPETAATLRRENLLSAMRLDDLAPLLHELASHDVYDLQERFVHLFDRSRTLSLNLFEHVHGDSRARGSAMVDLLETYRAAGLEPVGPELPDHLPILLEYLSQRPLREARDTLADAAHIFVALAERLDRRHSSYAAVFRALGDLAATEASAELIAEASAAPDDDPDNLEALDAVWEEAMVTFGPDPNAGCPAGRDILARMAPPAPAPLATEPLESIEMEFFFFQVFPYVALTILILGSIARYERAPFSWKSQSSQFLRRRQLIWGSILFHVGILIVFFGHLIGLLTPIELFDALGISHGVKQFMAIFVGGIAGIMAVVGGAMLLHRRLTDPRVRATSTFADTGILALLLLQLIIGLGTIIISLDHLDGGTMVRFMNYSRAIFTFQTDAWLQVVDVHWIFKLHIALGLFIFILFPFTRLVHMLSVPVRYLWRPYQIVRSRGSAGSSAGQARPKAPQPASPIPAVRPGTKIPQPHSTPAK